MVPSHDNSSPKQHDLQPGKKKKASQLSVMLATPSHAIESVLIHLRGSDSSDFTCLETLKFKIPPFHYFNILWRSRITLP